MPVTIKVNGTNLSLVHKMSNGISTATIPDVCKTPTPGGPVPIPYPNIAQSITLSDGTTTVKGDKVMAANKGSKFSLSNGDNAGTIGGVKSNVFMKEATWILYSFDVKMDSKNACRFTDPMYHNSENTVNLSGIFNPPVNVRLSDEEKAAGEFLCQEFCKEVKKALKPPNPNGSLQRGSRGGISKIPGSPKLSGSQNLESRLQGTWSSPNFNGGSLSIPKAGNIAGMANPDAIFTAANGVKRFFDFKFPGDSFRGKYNQLRRMIQQSGRNPVKINARNCSGCP
jgi:hypothetical protein